MSTPTTSGATTHAGRTSTATDPGDPPAGALIRRWLALASDRIVAHAPELTALDAAIGDGDHGINLGRGMAAVPDLVTSEEEADGGAQLRLVGRHLVSTVGGASGPLYGTLFIDAGTALGSGGRVSRLGTALRAGAAGVARRGRSAVGQKTMLDTLVPAIDALEDALRDGSPIAEACAAAARAARDGCAATAPMVAQRGRASYLGERAVGHLDPGAVSSRILIEALALAAQEEVARSEPAAVSR